MSVSEQEVAGWRGSVGNRTVRRERLEVGALRRFALALGEDADVERAAPPMAHWAFFLPEVAVDELDVDGHRRRGGFLPPITLPRRMFGAADILFAAPLLIGREATQIATVRSVTHKRGAAGDLVFVEVEHRISQEEVDRVVEVQTLIYREPGGRIGPVGDVGLKAEAGETLWRPDPVELFRFSAVTFNAHRIHYDLPYASESEGYPDLVVHGPLTAIRLVALALRGGPVLRYGFRAQAPLFVDTPILLRPAQATGRYEAVRRDGEVAMVAHVRRSA